jgi:penicillin-binding protein-related factor A (putative recombinase)
LQDWRTDYIANEGKILEQRFKECSKAQNVYFYRIKDTPPTMLKRNARTSPNVFDCFIFSKGYLFPTELKSTKGKSFSFSNKIIKEHQIESLKEAAQYDYLIPGFIFNFREPEDRTYFVHINDFLLYKDIAENQKEHTYKSKINEASIPIGICEEIGVQVKSVKARTRYTYYINKMCDDLIKKHS